MFNATTSERVRMYNTTSYIFPVSIIYDAMYVGGGKQLDAALDPLFDIHLKKKLVQTQNTSSALCLINW